MVERLLLVIVLFALGLAAYCLARRCNLRRAGASAPTDPILSGFRPGTPAVVYFTTPGCVPCRTQQQPALARLQTELGDRIQVIQIDAAQDPDAARRWGVFTAPTTFILDERGQPRDVNHGVADALKLRRQIEATALR